ncbi:hypothetical protein [Sphingomonas sp. 28-62-11]|uniref:hypothetical protein n=1 Tax=Sphingomonas sp. 28-62-11 TaxID=1970432 RepID=UPI000BCD99DC|nr:MAG: hypothetical protein B7Y49_04085 [Sphingomonas sp. 28-62-11]
MKHAVLLLALMLAACGTPATDASGASPSEAQALNEAAAMLDNDSVSANALVDNTSDQEAE